MAKILTLTPEWGDWDNTNIDRESEIWLRMYNADESEAASDNAVLLARNADLLRPQAEDAATHNGYNN